LKVDKLGEVLEAQAFGKALNEAELHFDG
jgi:hypothetical protein